MHVWLAFLLLAQAPPPQQEVLKLNADFVWGRQYRTDATNPVLVTIDNPGGAVEGSLILRWGLSQIYQPTSITRPEILQGATGPVYEIPVTLPEKSRRRYFAAVRGEKSDTHELWVFLMSGKKCLKSFAVTGSRLAAGKTVIGLVGNSLPGGMKDTGLSAFCTPENLPDQWHGFTVLDALLWLDADAANVGDPSQIEALKHWVAGGGHLVIGRSSTEGLAGTFLAELAPVTFGSAVPHVEWTPIAEYSGTSVPLTGDGAVLQVKERGAGRVLVTAAGRPLVVGAPFGKGRISFVAFDPSTPPFSNWRAAGTFWKKLLDLTPRAVPEKDPNEMYTTYDGLKEELGSNQLAQLLAFHPEVPLPAMGWAFLMIVIYVLLVGPVDYVVLRLLKRMELTWITFPAVVLVFSGIALTASCSISKYPAVMRETSVVDCLPDGQAARGWAMSSILTPVEKTLAVSTRKPHPLMSSQFVREDGGAARDAVMRPGRIDDWFFLRGSTGVAIVRWCENGAPVQATAANGKLTVTNDSGAEVGDAFFLWEGNVYSLGRLPAGASTHALDALPKRWRGSDLMAISSSAGDHGISGSAEQVRLRAGLRQELIRRSFQILIEPLKPSEAMMAEIDASSWLKSGNGILIAWSEGSGIVDIEGISPQRTIDTLWRVYVRHD